MCLSSGSQRDLGQTNFPALQQNAQGKTQRVGKGIELANNNSTPGINGSMILNEGLTPTNGSETVV